MKTPIDRVMERLSVVAELMVPSVWSEPLVVQDRDTITRWGCDRTVRP